MSQCTGCSMSFDVGVVVASTTLTFTVAADPCCMLTDCKMLKSVLVDAICQYVAANAATVQTVDAAFYEQLHDKCNRCSSFDNMVFTCSTKRIVATLAATTGLANASVTVVPPFADINT